MRHDLTVFFRDLQDRLDWLVKEVSRLQEENERLLKENKTLREEVTLARLFRDLEPTAEVRQALAPSGGGELFEPPPAVSWEAMEFYRVLPKSFTFAEFFQAAEGAGVAGNAARDYMLVYFRENLLQQRGTRIEKTQTAASYPRRMAR